MKKINIIIQAILLVAVIILFILHFTGKGGVGTSGTNDTTQVAAKINSSIAYVDIDSVLLNYDMMKDMRTEIEKESKQYEAELSGKQKKLEAVYQDLNYKAQKGLELRSKLEEEGQKLNMEMQNLNVLKDKYAYTLQEKNVVNNRKGLDNIMQYLKKYNQGKNFHYILGNAFDGKILYANESLNITTEILKGLNEEYAAQKKSAGK